MPVTDKQNIDTTEIDLFEVIRNYVSENALIPPLTIDELKHHTGSLIRNNPQWNKDEKYITIMLNNSLWEDTVSAIPFERRILLLPQCLKDPSNCKADMDEFGLLCKQCGSCLIGEFQEEAEKLGYIVLVAEGTYYENVRFMGKAITLGSEYIMDGDTDHIINTIINGNQPTNSDSAACVMFVHSEDTNSILNGFTITEGSGVYRADLQVRSGGGIYARSASAKIVNNTIIYNEVEGDRAGGAGISFFGDGSNNLAVIDNNIVMGKIINNNFLFKKQLARCFSNFFIIIYRYSKFI